MLAIVQSTILVHFRVVVTIVVVVVMVVVVFMIPGVETSLCPFPLCPRSTIPEVL